MLALSKASTYLKFWNRVPDAEKCRVPGYPTLCKQSLKNVIRMPYERNFFIQK